MRDMRRDKSIHPPLSPDSRAVYEERLGEGLGSLGARLRLIALPLANLLAARGEKGRRVALRRASIQLRRGLGIEIATWFFHHEPA